MILDLQAILNISAFGCTASPAPSLTPPHSPDCGSALSCKWHRAGSCPVFRFSDDKQNLSQALAQISVILRTVFSSTSVTQFSLRCSRDVSRARAPLFQETRLGPEFWITAPQPSSPALTEVCRARAGAFESERVSGVKPGYVRWKHYPFLCKNIQLNRSDQ